MLPMLVRVLSSAIACPVERVSVVDLCSRGWLLLDDKHLPALETDAQPRVVPSVQDVAHVYKGRLLHYGSNLT